MKATGWPIIIVAIAMAANCYVFKYGYERIQIFGRSVGFDVIVIGYVVPTLALAGSVYAFSAANGRVFLRRFAGVSTVISVVALGFWAWVHLTGGVVAYIPKA